jgi:hypothetical protein
MKIENENTFIDNLTPSVQYTGFLNKMQTSYTEVNIGMIST